MAMTELQKIQKSIEKAKTARNKVKQRRQDIQDLKDAGVYISPDDLYLDQYGHVKPDTPTWYRNIRKAWTSNRTIHQKSNGLKEKGYASVKRKRKKKPIEMKPRKVKIKRSVQMKLLLEDHGINILENGSVEDYDGFQFLPNGRIRTNENDVISAIQFIRDYV